METLNSFIEAFATLGYAPCNDGTFEADLEKLVIYLDGGVPTHMARQLDSGVWTSKPGSSWDIEHLAPIEVNGEIYGGASQYLARRRTLLRKID